ncbi:pheromone-binding protein-related protein 6 [Orussus abietinus]|uniref:pheromone-binding protein-related protein 6 n=1 Tax=Orussus abietinus TaxID=222816 RepID=UPI0006254337|nr:pheromone-binding protein-related protein 6 [Orussus abietinus]
MKGFGTVFVAASLLQIVLVSAKVPDWVTPEMLAMVKDDKETCMSTHSTTQDMIDQVDNGFVPDIRSLKCYMHCLFEAISMIDEDGNLEVELMTGMLPENMQDDARNVLDKCSKEDGADECEKVYNIATCIGKANPKLMVII